MMKGKEGEKHRLNYKRCLLLLFDGEIYDAT